MFGRLLSPTLTLLLPCTTTGIVTLNLNIQHNKLTYYIWRPGKSIPCVYCIYILKLINNNCSINCFVSILKIEDPTLRIMMGVGRTLD